MTSSARRATVELTVPPLEEAWKNWLSSNSHACAACARKTVSTLAYWRRMPCSAKKKNCFASRRCASSMLPETSSAKITAAFIEGVGRFTSCRKRRSSFTMAIGFSWIAWRFTASFLLCEEGGHVVQRLARAVRVVAVLVDEPLLHHGDFLPRLLVGPRAGAHQTQHVAALLEQVLLDCVVQRRVAV